MERAQLTMDGLGKRKVVWTFTWSAYLVLMMGVAATARESFYVLISLYFTLFALYTFWMVRGPLLSTGNFLLLIILVRLPFFFFLPQLSDDFYRFLWDGNMLAAGHNPFGAIPADADLGIFADQASAKILLDGMNSAEYGSVYPPLHQLIFWIGAQFSRGSLLGGVNAMRCMILLAELGMAFYFIRFSGLKSGVFLAAAYLFHPLVVVEGSGNVHMEALMVPLLAVGLHMLLTQKTMKGSILFACSVLVKLTPLLLAPLLFFHEKAKARWKMTVIVAAFVAFAFLAFSPWKLLEGLDQNFGLYFSTFEFNASVYYLLREAITPLLGYNPIGILGPALGVVTLVAVLWFAFAAKRFNFYTAALYSYVIFYLLATTVHPWYLLPVVYLSLAAKRPVWLVWSFTVWLSYSHYVEPLGPKWGWLLAEYGVLAITSLLEWRGWRFGKQVGSAS